MNMNTALLAACLMFASHAFAQTPLTGTWKISLHGDHVIPMGLQLTQQDEVLSGFVTFMGKDIPATGEFKDGAITLAGNAALMSSGGDSSTQTKLSLKGKLLEDGTMSGEMPMPHGNMKWTADRFRQRKAKTTDTSINGSWVLTTQGDRVIEAPLELKLTGNDVAGTLQVHGQPVPVIGSFENGKLDLKNDPQAKSNPVGNFAINGTQSSDGALTGSLKSQQGEMRWTAKRL